MKQIIVVILLLIGETWVSAAQKIVGFSHDIPPAERVKSIESIGGVVREFHLIDALVATIPEDIKDADVFSLNGVIDVEEDIYIRWIDAFPAALQLSSIEALLKQIKEGEYELAVVGEI